MLLRCYPKITDWIFHVFNQSPTADFRFLPVYSYGFFVATGFFAAATLAVAEMKRREALGLLKGQEVEITVNETPGIAELLITFFLTFTVFYKLTGIFAYHEMLRTHQLEFGRYLISVDGNILQKILSIYKYGSWVGGLTVAVLFTGFYYKTGEVLIGLFRQNGYTKYKEMLARSVKKMVMVYPSDSMGDLVVIAAVLGVLGSNLFNFLENPSDYQNFWSDPFGSLFSGLSVYGGLILAGIGFGIYAYRKKFNLGHFFDSVAPGFILANGLGRIGCQVAGDGDWGIANLAAKPGWLPQWLWSTHYEHNIIDADPMNIIPNCTEEHCHFLTNPVYPTPVYEFLMCTAIFFILFSLRKRLTYKPWMTFTIFMMLIGIQRYTIEQWRDASGRDLYHIFGVALRQSEIISIVLFIVGLVTTIYLYNLYKKPGATTS